jgi:L-fucose isomerase
MATMKNPVLENLPKIGIRPTIDGRLGGVRESLEDRTMAQARSVPPLIAGNLRYPDGSPVECVIADTCIGGVREAAACADKFRSENVGRLPHDHPLLVLRLRDDGHGPAPPKAVWGFNGTERPGAVYLAAVLAGHTQKGLPAFGIYGKDVQEATDTTSRRTSRQAAQLRQPGSPSPSCAARPTSRWAAPRWASPGRWSTRLVGKVARDARRGHRHERIRRPHEQGQYDQAEFEKALAWVKKNCPEGKDYNSTETTSAPASNSTGMGDSVKMALIARDLMVGNPKLAEMGLGEQAQGHYAIAAGFQGQRQWTDHFPNGDFMEAILNLLRLERQARPVHRRDRERRAQRRGMLFGHLLTNTAQIFADLRTYWSPEAVAQASGHKLGRGPLVRDGILHLINSGPAALDGTGEQTDADGKPVMKPFWEITDEEVEACLKATTWHPSITEYFPGGGWSTRYRTKGGMPATMIRLNLGRRTRPGAADRRGPHRRPADEGSRRPRPAHQPDLADHLVRADPHRRRCAFRSTYEVMNNWGANHCVMTYGHVGHLYITLASMLRIPVYMHNVAEERVFRPSAWRAFGTADLEGADFRACATYGPLYG